MIRRGSRTSRTMHHARRTIYHPPSRSSPSHHPAHARSVSRRLALGVALSTQNANHGPRPSGARAEAANSLPSRTYIWPHPRCLGLPPSSHAARELPFLQSVTYSALPDVQHAREPPSPIQPGASVLPRRALCSLEHPKHRDLCHVRVACCSWWGWVCDVRRAGLPRDSPELDPAGCLACIDMCIVRPSRPSLDPAPSPHEYTHWRHPHTHSMLETPCVRVPGRIGRSALVIERSAVSRFWAVRTGWGN